MLVVLASGHDATAQAIVAAWAPWGAELCTPADLSTPGWRHRVGAPEKAVAVIGGQVFPVAAIMGVLTRLPAVQPEELGHIATADRNYVASEMTAFLVAFVSALPGRVLNRPSAGSLSGPAWRQEQWIRAAAMAGIPIRPSQRSVRPNAPALPETDVAVEVTVIGDRVFGAAEARMAGWARSLAKAAGVGLLGLGFARHASGYALTSVNPSPDLDTPDRLDAAREFLLAGTEGPTP
jgi:hypothetical protein